MTFSTRNRFLSGAGVSALALTVALGGLGVAGQARAQTSHTITDQLELQIQALQKQLDELKQSQAAAAQAAAAAQQAAAAAQQKATQAETSNAANVTFDKKKGLKLGALNLKLGGFVAAEAIAQDKSETTSIGTSFSPAVVPFRGGAQSPNYHQSYIAPTARQSRLTLLADGDPDRDTHISGYFEGDFLGAAASANEKESNSYTPRIRQIWAGWERQDLGLHVFAGQMWTLATLDKQGMLPLNELIPASIDASYVPGFTYLRNPELRVVENWQNYWLGVALDLPQTLISGAAPGTVENAVNAGNGFGMQGTPGGVAGLSSTNGLVNYSNSILPDVTVKGAVDTDVGHFELFGVARDFEDRITSATTAAAHENANEIGGGVGAAALFHVVPHTLDLTLNGLWGYGTGRYGATQLPDVTYNPDGSFAPIENVQAMLGALYTPVAPLLVYSYLGIEQDHSTSTGGVNGNGNGVGGTTTTGCYTELGACTVAFHRIEQGTVGDWWKFYQGPVGTMQWGVSYSLTRFDAFRGSAAGSSANPHTYENEVFVSFRYYPFD